MFFRRNASVGIVIEGDNFGHLTGTGFDHINNKRNVP